MEKDQYLLKGLSEFIYKGDKWIFKNSAYELTEIKSIF